MILREENIELRPSIRIASLPTQPAVTTDTQNVQTLPVGEIAREAVKYVPQDLSDDQKRIARENIGLGDMDPSPVQIYEEAKGAILK